MFAYFPSIGKLRYFDNDKIDFVDPFRYLEYMPCNDMNFEENVIRVRRNIYAQFNSILISFHFTDMIVKLFLFRQYCLSMYGLE